MKPQVEARTATVVESMNMPARKATTVTLRRRTTGSFSVRPTTAKTSAAADMSARREKMLERSETAGESRPTMKTKYRPKAACGILRAWSRISVITEDRTIRSELFRRPGVGNWSCQNLSIHDAMVRERELAEEGVLEAVFLEAMLSGTATSQR